LLALILKAETYYLSIGLLIPTEGSSIAELFWFAVANSTSPTIGILEPKHPGIVSGHAGHGRFLALSEAVDLVKLDAFR
jgi:hypothetical protein